MLPAERAQLRELVQPAGRRLVVYHGHVREPLAHRERAPHSIEADLLARCEMQGRGGDPVTPGDLTDPLAVHAVLEHEQPSVGGNERRQHGLDHGGARSAESHRRPIGGVEVVHREQLHAHRGLQLQELRLAMAEIVRAERAPDARAEGHRAGIQQDHPPIPRRWSTKRARTRSGESFGRGSSGRVPGRIFSDAKRGPPTFPAAKSSSSSVSSSPSSASA